MPWLPGWRWIECQNGDSPCTRHRHIGQLGWGVGGWGLPLGRRRCQLLKNKYDVQSSFTHLCFDWWQEEKRILCSEQHGSTGTKLLQFSGQLVNYLKKFWKRGPKNARDVWFAALFPPQAILLWWVYSFWSHLLSSKHRTCREERPELQRLNSSNTELWYVCLYYTCKDISSWCR